MDDKRLEAAMDTYGTWIKDHPVRLVKFDIAEDIMEQHKGAMKAALEAADLAGEADTLGQWIEKEIEDQQAWFDSSVGDREKAFYAGRISALAQVRELLNAKGVEHDD